MAFPTLAAAPCYGRVALPAVDGDVDGDVCGDGYGVGVAVPLARFEAGLRLHDRPSCCHAISLPTLYDQPHYTWQNVYQQLSPEVQVVGVLSTKGLDTPLTFPFVIRSGYSSGRVADGP